MGSIAEDSKIVFRALSVFMENSSDMIFIKDKSLHYISASETFLKMVNCAGNYELRGKSDYDIFSKELADKYIGDDKTVLATGNPILGEVERIPSVDGLERFCSTSKYAIKDDNGEIIGLYGIGRDITDQVELADQAYRASSIKSDFLARMSHDMRTPMNGILGLIALSMDEPMSNTARDNLRKIENSSKYLLSLINDILDMTKLESSKISLNCEPVSSTEYVESIIDSVKPSVQEKNIDFVVNVRNVDFVPIIIDKVRIQQIFTNILSNAIKFTPPGGRVEATLECLGREDHVAHDKFTVRDTGIGISKEFLPKIFEPFEQENNSSEYAGTGLGMSIVKNLVDMMDGRIEVKSEQGVGTEVTVWLDLLRAEDAKPASTIIDYSEKHLDGARILLCEDNKLNAEITVRLLNSKGCIIDLANNGVEGVKRFSQSPEGYYKAVLMDIRMPVMDGNTAAKEIRALDRADAREVPIIAMTANAFESDIQQSKESGMDAHLAKPIEPKLLFKTIDNLLGKSLERTKGE